MASVPKLCASEGRHQAQPRLGDAVFPDFDDVTEWRLADSEHHEADEKNALPYSFLTYERVAPARNRGKVESG